MRIEKNDIGPVTRGYVLKTEEQIERWLKKEIAERLMLDVTEIDPNVPLMDYGLDSFHVVTMSGELGRRIDRDVSPELIWDYPTIRAIASHLGVADERCRPVVSSQDQYASA